MSQYNEKIREIANDRDVHFLELEYLLPKTSDYFYDDVHYQDRSYDIISDTISAYIIGKQLFR